MRVWRTKIITLEPIAIELYLENGNEGRLRTNFATKEMFRLPNWELSI